MATNETETSKRALAKHEYFTINGGDTDDETEAHGYRYTHLRTGGSVERMWSDLNADAQRMFGIFGMKTLASNEASQVKQAGGAEVNPAPAIEARFNLLQNERKWVDRTREGFTVNLDTLAAATFEILTKYGKAADYASLRDRMETDKEFVKKTKSNPEVNALYIEKVGRPTASIDELAELHARDHRARA